MRKIVVLPPLLPSVATSSHVESGGIFIKTNCFITHKPVPQ